MIYVLLSLFSLLLLILLVPVGVELDYSEQGRKWFLVWFGLRIPVPGIAKKAEELLRDEDEGENRSSEDAKRPRAEEEREIRDFPQASEIVHSMTSNVHMFKRGLDAVRSISRHIHVKVHRLDMVVASPNPALTGFAYGMTQALGHAIGGKIPWHTEPDFQQTEPAISFRVEVSVMPITMFPPILRFARHLMKRKVTRYRQRAKKTVNR